MIRTEAVYCPKCRKPNPMNLNDKKLPSDVTWIKCNVCGERPPIELWRYCNQQLVMNTV